MFTCLTIWNQEYIIGFKYRQSGTDLHMIDIPNFRLDKAAFSLINSNEKSRATG
jgi:hypothetical protein